MRIPMPADWIVCIVRRWHGLGPGRGWRGHGVSLHLGIVRIEIFETTESRRLTLERNTALGRRSQNWSRFRYGRRGRSGRKWGRWSLICIVGMAVISTRRRMRRKRRSRMSAVSWFHHHWITRIGLLVGVRMVFPARPAREEALTSSVAICMRRRRTVRPMRMILR